MKEGDVVAMGLGERPMTVEAVRGRWVVCLAFDPGAEDGLRHEVLPFRDLRVLVKAKRRRGGCRLLTATSAG